MHEYGLMEAVVVQALDACHEREDLAPVRVRVQVGEFAFASRESLETAFEILTRATPLEGARLDLEIVPGLASCEACGFAGTAADLGQGAEEPPALLLCPRCGMPLVVKEGSGAVLAGVQLQDRGGSGFRDPVRGGR